MGYGHVDEIYERPVRASFSESSSLSQLFGDLDQTIDLRHRHVLFLMAAAAAPICFCVSPIIPRTPIKPL
jgi:hypothetical protein